MRRVLVTGASGYIGRHLVQSLLKDGVAVRCFSQSPSLARPSAAEWQQGDVRRLADHQPLDAFRSVFAQEGPPSDSLEDVVNASLYFEIKTFGMVHRPTENYQARGGFVIHRIVE